MKILVGIKRVVDFNVRIRVKSDGSGVDTDGVKMSINPFDEIALEEALRIREAGMAEEVIVVSLGGNECQQQLRTGLAMGADRAIQVDADAGLQPLTIARIFHKVMENYALPIYATCNENEKNSRRVLERMGFELVEGRMYKWQQQYRG